MIKKIFRALGTLNEISVFDNSQRTILERAETLVNNMDANWSVFRENSEISQINRLAGQEFVAVCRETYDILEQSAAYSELTGGIFDVTMQPLIERLSPQKYSDIPSDGEVTHLLSFVNYRDILFQAENFGVKLKRPGQKISLGAVAKGYAVQKVTELFRQNGISDAVINLGGTVSVMGSERVIGLQHPLKKTGQIMGRLSIKDKIAVTSGAYEQEYIRNGMKFHHILDPRTGSSSQSDLLSVTLVGEDGAMLDALATAVFILGFEQGCHLAEKIGFQAVFVTDSLSIFATDGLKKMLSIQTTKLDERCEF